MSGLAMQRVMLDLLEHVNEPLEFRSTFQTAFPEGPVISSRDAAEVEERLRSRMNGIGILPRGRMFSNFRREHLNEAIRVIKLLIGLEDRDLQLAMAFLRDRINEELFVYVLNIITFHKPEMRGVRLPPIEEVLPDKFLPAGIISRARNMVRRKPESQNAVVIEVDFTGNDLDLEHRLAYWREDIDLNAHHWHWHIVYPITWLPEMGGSKDRKGELFYYMHQQMLARYDAERLSHNLSRVTTYDDWNDAIPEGYAPHLSKETSGTVYASRPVNMVLQDLPNVSINRLRTWYERILDSIHRGFILMPDGTREQIDEFTGIDKVGDIVESSLLSPNPDYYGDFHNNGHVAISLIHDPDGRFREEMGVMGDAATAMRDPIFYRWHKLIDLLYQEHKNTLAPYGQQLLWSDIEVEDIQIQGNVSQLVNNLQTFWEDREIRLDRGLNFNSPTPVTVQVRHLQHEPFQYVVDVSNKTSAAVTGTVRIFMAPRLNELQEPFELNDQRHLFMEMDKFEVQLQPGKNKVNRNSADSNVTLPVSNVKSFSQLIADVESSTPEEQQSYCSCGLPDHLLLPRGKPEGMPFQIFVMVTNSRDDRVVGNSGQTCQDATSYCGILNELYPDRKPMGYPFDRRIEEANLTEFKTTNMNFADVVIRFRSDVVNRSGTGVFFPES